MPTTLKILRDYVRESGAAVLTFLGGLAVLLLSLLRDIVQARWGWTLPPEATVVGGIALMVLGQFKAYYTLRQRFPLGVDRRLAVLYQKPEKDRRTEDDRRQIELGLLDPMPDEVHTILFGVKETTSAASVVLGSDRPIYQTFVYWRPPDGEPIASLGEPGGTTLETKLPIPLTPLVAGTVFEVRLRIDQPMRLERASLVTLTANPPRART